MRIKGLDTFKSMVRMSPGLKNELKRLDIIWGRDYTHGGGKMEEITGTKEMSRRTFM